MNIEKIGFIYSCDKISDWMHSYASLPIAKHIKESIFRIYFSPRDSQNRSNGSYLELDIKSPKKILKIAENPILESGIPGMFDDCGAQPCSILEIEGRQYMYYTGWSLGASIPFRTYLGLAIREADGDCFVKYSLAPILDRNDSEPLSVGWCFVMIHDGIFKMWYESNIGWKKINNQWEHFFNIKYAESKDGIYWERRNRVCIDIKGDENVVSRPSVLFEDNKFKMWYCFKVNRLYRLGYAESLDGINWVRLDNEITISGTSENWDNEEMAYPFVFNHEGNKYLLYNGNKYGKTGFGLAQIKNN